MAKEETQNNEYSFAAIIAGVLISGFIGLYIISWLIFPILSNQESQPMLLVEFDSWGENINDSSEVGFGYFVFNFGDIEAKNVMITCDISNANEVIIKSQTFNIGNIASNSYQYKESFMNYYGNSLEEYGICYIESADEEHINLKDKLNIIE